MTRHKANAPDLAFMPVLEWRIAGTANPCPVVGVAQVLGAPAQRNFNNRFYPGMLGALYAKRIDALLMRRGR